MSRDAADTSPAAGWRRIEQNVTSWAAKKQAREPIFGALADAENKGLGGKSQSSVCATNSATLRPSSDHAETSLGAADTSVRATKYEY